ncbi:aspartate/glutamate racemase family protein [Pedobacter sp. MR22-3]|uniref:aspartate/glutamate racemase family protein n=1 Tax=Pedobacter TaxID=84567 RepID=UPI002246336F|nr:amino acid racemase [Pedobacter sp. MR22-3]
MDLEQDKVIGIVGGMGPQSGLTLFNHILNLTKAKYDQEHFSVVLMSFPKHIEDRTSFLDGLTIVNPAINIVHIIHKLESAGAKVVGMACNTSYVPGIYDVILTELGKKGSKIKLLHMPIETCKYIIDNCKSARTIGVMNTNGSYKSNLYNNLLSQHAFNVITPDVDFQNEVIHKLIYDSNIGLKANPNFITEDAKVLYWKAIAYFKDRKADVIILGCTELSVLAADDFADDIIIIDSMLILAKALIKEVTSEN